MIYLDRQSENGLCFLRAPNPEWVPIFSDCPQNYSTKSHCCNESFLTLSYWDAWWFPMLKKDKLSFFNYRCIPGGLSWMALTQEFSYKKFVVHLITIPLMTISLYIRLPLMFLFIFLFCVLTTLGLNMFFIHLLCLVFAELLKSVS